MAQKAALRPYEDIRTIWQKKREVEGEKSGIDPEDMAFATLFQTEGWGKLRTHINNLKQGLDKRLAESVLASLGDAQIKNDALFAVLGKELLDSIINKVEDSALVVEELEDERKQREDTTK